MLYFHCGFLCNFSSIWGKQPLGFSLFSLIQVALHPDLVYLLFRDLHDISKLGGL